MKAAVFVVLLALAACNGQTPTPPVCGKNESCQCVEGYERGDVGDCVKIVPPPPPPSPPPVEPEDYITITRAGDLGERCVVSTGLLRELCFDEQQLIWDGIRHPDYALGHCCARLPGPWPITVIDCVSLEVELNRVVFAELHEFMTKLQQVNRRCKPTHPDYAPMFCDHTNVNKLVFKAWRADRLEPSMNIAERLRGIDSWCREE